MLTVFYIHQINFMRLVKIAFFCGNNTYATQTDFFKTENIEGKIIFLSMSEDTTRFA